jgi:phosphatidylcholine synthase
MNFAAIAVHVLTALGAVLALLATLAVDDGRYELAFAWLGLAFVVDGIDGPIARAVGVKQRLPRFSGETLDLVIDYLTYVFVPVLALLAAARLPDGLAMPLAAAILLSSLFHFSDTASKSEDLAFVGFPAVWNIVAFYVFALDMRPAVVAVVIAVAVALTFVPLHWVHPMRVVAARPLTLAATALWSGAAAWTVWRGFPAPLAAQLALGGVAVYGVVLSLWLSRREH